VTALDIIREKRDGQAHSRQAIEFLVRGATDGSIPDYQLAAWLMAVRLKGMTDAEVKTLTLAMAASGPAARPVVDPGQEGATSTQPAAWGTKRRWSSRRWWPRPASQSPNCPAARSATAAGRWTSSSRSPDFASISRLTKFIDQVRRIGIAIAGQTADMVPADKALYALRDATATVDSVPLIASSVMSKKLAAGADAILLDVKCGRGAFVPTVEDAEALAQALVAIGAGAGRETVAYVTDMEQPLGFAVGNALEVREAIATLAGHGPGDLEALCLRLGAEMLRLAGSPPIDLRQRLADGSALRKFAQLITAQSGDAGVADDPSRLPTAPLQQPVLAVRAGRVAAIDALEIALAGKALGGGRDHKDSPIDLAVGVVLCKKVGDAVESGEPLATVHARTGDDFAKVAARVAAAFSIARDAQPRPLLLRRVTASTIERLDT